MTAAIIVGFLALVILAVCVGASLDTAAQRRAAQEVAQARRALRDERFRLNEERRPGRWESSDDD